MAAQKTTLVPADIPILCFDAPLYETYTLPPARVETVGSGDITLGNPPPATRRISFPESLYVFTGTVDRYCQACGQLSTFRGTAPDLYPHGISIDLGGSGRLLVKRFVCSRDASHLALFLFVCSDSVIIKVGQLPSLADLAEGDLARYRRTLDRVRVGLFASFRRGIGLAAHGIGAGSLVYLRRIIEALFEVAHAEARADEGWNEEAYNSARMPEKIDMLKTRLPDFVVSHKALYGILSDGIHNLEEEECLANFGLLRTSIELILDARIEREGRERKILETQKAVVAIEAKFKARKAAE